MDFIEGGSPPTYYYHPDHVGSTSYVTDNAGQISQHVEYLPFGEVFVENDNSTYQTPYLFNCKELDEETGLYFYGARYYDPVLSNFINVDPIAHEFPFLTPYNYGNNSPVSKIDIWGLQGRTSPYITGYKLHNFEDGTKSVNVIFATVVVKAERTHVKGTGLSVSGVSLKSQWSEDLSNAVFKTLAPAFAVPAAPILIEGLGVQGVLSFGIEGAASLVTDTQFDFFDATVGRFGGVGGALTSSVLSPLFDISSSGITTFNDKSNNQLIGEYIFGGIGLGSGLFGEYLKKTGSSQLSLANSLSDAADNLDYYSNLSPTFLSSKANMLNKRGKFNKKLGIALSGEFKLNTPNLNKLLLKSLSKGNK